VPATVEPAERVERVEFLVEEASMDEALRALLPTILGAIDFEVRRFQGRSDLLQSLPDRLRGYAAWLPASWRIVVVVDRDDDSCEKLKRQLDDVAHESGLAVRRPGGAPWQIVNRLAIEELEAWFFGDWAAVRAAYPRVPATIPSKQPYRAPDAIRGGTWEAFERVLQQAGYFAGGLRKIEAAREVARHMAAARNRSPSFGKLREILVELAGTR
jgi:hypothetical protein